MSAADTWLERLAAGAAMPGTGAAGHFGDAAGEIAAVATETTKTPLADCGLLRIDGDEAGGFLHAQFSGDVLAQGEDVARLMAWCTPKGRVQYLPRLARHAADFFVLLPRDQAGAFARRLSMFVLRARVGINDLSGTHGVIVVHRCPSRAGAEDGSETDGVLRVSSEDRRQCWYLGPFDALAAAWPGIAGRPVGGNAAALAEIRLGQPRLEGALLDQFLPQELNLDALGGVSFEKGCYPGQEIVARVKFRGAVKRRLSRLAARTDELPEPGRRIVPSPGESPVGTVLFSAPAGANCIELLSVLDLGCGAIALEGAAGVVLERGSLPYSVAS